jgi:DNA-binding NarL/FixJ family response regulator
MRVAVVDDHPLFLSGVVQTLRGDPGIEVVATGASAEDAILIALDLKPDVIVLDMCMAGAADGIAAIATIKTGAPSIRTLVLSATADEERVVESIRKGACGYILKGIGGAELIRVIHLVHGGETYVTPTLATRLVAHLGGPPTAPDNAASASQQLGPREEQILSLIVEGFSNKEIGKRLALSDKTIKHYITGMLQKLKVRNRTEAAVAACQYLRRSQQDQFCGGASKAMAGTTGGFAIRNNSHIG